MKLTQLLKKRDLAVAGITIAIICIPCLIIARKQAAEMQSVAIDFTSLKVVPSKIGEKRQVFDAATKTLDNIECHISTLNPGELAHPPHQHPEEELTIVKEGTIEVLVNGETKRVGPGSVVFQASNQLHSTKNVGTTPAIYYALRWRTAKTK